MLIIRCAACKTKIWRYYKVGKGEVLRCHKSRVRKVFEHPRTDGDKVCCPSCGEVLGIDKGTFVKMVRPGFTYSGTKDTA